MACAGEKDILLRRLRGEEYKYGHHHTGLITIISGHVISEKCGYVYYYSLPSRPALRYGRRGGLNCR
jgi:hypothetical protein